MFLQWRRMILLEGTAGVSQPPEPAPKARGQPCSLQSIVRPSCSILEYMLNATGQEFRAIRVCEPECTGSCLVYVPCRCALRVRGEIAQNWLDELIVGRNGHVDVMSNLQLTSRRSVAQ